MRKLALILWLLTSVAVANQQDGSLNTYNGDGSNVNSNNTTEDRSTSTSNTYNGAGSSSQMPVGSAITPSYMSNGVETCLQGVGTSLQTVIVGYSKGKYKADADCNRRRDARLLSDLGMKVAAVARMCEGSVEVFRAMLNSGTPCPILQNNRLLVGKRAFLAMKTQPEIYIPDYSENTEWYNAILKIGEVSDETAEDILSVSDKFRSSIK